VNNKPLWKISITTTSEAEDAVSEILHELVGQPVSSYTDIETGITTVTSYLSKKPDQFVCATLPEEIARVKTCGLDVGAGTVSLRRIRREHWAESWKRHFRPIEIGQTLLIKPGWIKRRPRKGQAAVVLDPGLSFGTGQHPTTLFCLQQLAAHRGTSRSFLDIGTGSGILAISAVKLGFDPVNAFDFDPEAVRVARANARRNRVLHRTRIDQADLTRMPMRSRRRYHVVCANLISTLLIAERDRILGRLEAGGVLILAGILKSEFAEVDLEYRKVGLKLLASRTEKEWRSGAYKFSEKSGR
jgi:ribosomal protein L11 methyltransferase